jgi:hypothetical protein
MRSLYCNAPPFVIISLFRGWMAAGNDLFSTRKRVITGHNPILYDLADDSGFDQR